MDTLTRKPLDRDEVPLAYVLRLVWRRKWLILGIAVLFGLGAALAAAFSPSKYESSIVLSPVTQSPNGGLTGTLSSLASQFGGLASLAGISVGNDTRKAETLAVLQSEALTERYIAENDLLPVLFADRWDPVRKRWRTQDATRIPTPWQANRLFEGRVRSVRIDAKTGLVTMTITWTDPKTAARWANGLVRMTNDYLRNRAVEESARNIAYLNSEASKTDMVGVKQAIYEILESEISKEMLARGSDEYALKVIDPAVPPERRSSPVLKLWTGVGVLGGAFLAVLFVLIAARMRLLLAEDAERALESESG